MSGAGGSVRVDGGAVVCYDGGEYRDHDHDDVDDAHGPDGLPEAYYAVSARPLAEGSWGCGGAAARAHWERTITARCPDYAHQRAAREKALRDPSDDVMNVMRQNRAARRAVNAFRANAAAAREAKQQPSSPGLKYMSLQKGWGGPAIPKKGARLVHPTTTCNIPGVEHLQEAFWGGRGGEGQDPVCNASTYHVSGGARAMKKRMSTASAWLVPNVGGEGVKHGHAFGAVGSAPDDMETPTTLSPLSPQGLRLQQQQQQEYTGPTLTVPRLHLPHQGSTVSAPSSLSWSPRSPGVGEGGSLGRGHAATERGSRRDNPGGSCASTSVASPSSRKKGGGGGGGGSAGRALWRGARDPTASTRPTDAAAVHVCEHVRAAHAQQQLAYDSGDVDAVRPMTQRVIDARSAGLPSATPPTSRPGTARRPMPVKLRRPFTASVAGKVQHEHDTAAQVGSPAATAPSRPQSGRPLPRQQGKPGDGGDGDTSTPSPRLGGTAAHPFSAVRKAGSGAKRVDVEFWEAGGARGLAAHPPQPGAAKGPAPRPERNRFAEAVTQLARTAPTTAPATEGGTPANGTTIPRALDGDGGDEAASDADRNGSGCPFVTSPAFREFSAGDSGGESLSASYSMSRSVPTSQPPSAVSVSLVSVAPPVADRSSPPPQGLSSTGSRRRFKEQLSPLTSTEDCGPPLAAPANAAGAPPTAAPGLLLTASPPPASNSAITVSPQSATTATTTTTTAAALSPPPPHRMTSEAALQLSMSYGLSEQSVDTVGGVGRSSHRHVGAETDAEPDYVVSPTTVRNGCESRLIETESETTATALSVSVVAGGGRERPVQRQHPHTRPQSGRDWGPWVARRRAREYITPALKKVRGAGRPVKQVRGRTGGGAVYVHKTGGRLQEVLIPQEAITSAAANDAGAPLLPLPSMSPVQSAASVRTLASADGGFGSVPVTALYTLTSGIRHIHSQQSLNHTDSAFSLTNGGDGDVTTTGGGHRTTNVYPSVPSIPGSPIESGVGSPASTAHWQSPQRGGAGGGVEMALTTTRPSDATTGTGAGSGGGLSSHASGFFRPQSASMAGMIYQHYSSGREHASPPTMRPGFVLRGSNYDRDDDSGSGRGGGGGGFLGPTSAAAGRPRQKASRGSRLLSIRDFDRPNDGAVAAATAAKMRPRPRHAGWERAVQEAFNTLAGATSDLKDELMEMVNSALEPSVGEALRVGTRHDTAASTSMTASAAPSTTAASNAVGGDGLLRRPRSGKWDITALPSEAAAAATITTPTSDARGDASSTTPPPAGGGGEEKYDAMNTLRDELSMPPPGSLKERAMVQDMHVITKTPIPQDLLDPVTGQLFYEPVLCGADNHVYEKATIQEGEDLLVQGLRPEDTANYPPHWGSKTEGQRLLTGIRATWVTKGGVALDIDSATHASVERWLRPKRVQLKMSLDKLLTTKGESVDVTQTMAAMLMELVDVVLDDAARGRVWGGIQRGRKWHEVGAAIEAVHDVQRRLRRLTARIEAARDEQMQMAERVMRMLGGTDLGGSIGGSGPAAALLGASMTGSVAPLLQAQQLVKTCKTRWVYTHCLLAQLHAEFRELTTQLQEAQYHLKLMWCDGRGNPSIEALQYDAPLVVFLPKPEADAVDEALAYYPGKLAPLVLCPPWQQVDAFDPHGVGAALGSTQHAAQHLKMNRGGGDGAGPDAEGPSGAPSHAAGTIIDALQRAAMFSHTPESVMTKQSSLISLQEVLHDRETAGTPGSTPSDPGVVASPPTAPALAPTGVGGRYQRSFLTGSVSGRGTSTGSATPPPEPIKPPKVRVKANLSLDATFSYETTALLEMSPRARRLLVTTEQASVGQRLAATHDGAAPDARTPETTATQASSDNAWRANVDQ